MYQTKLYFKHFKKVWNKKKKKTLINQYKNINIMTLNKCKNKYKHNIMLVRHNNCSLHFKTAKPDVVAAHLSEKFKFKFSNANYYPLVISY